MSRDGSDNPGFAPSPQVEKGHYFGQGYDHKSRFAGYWYEIHEVLAARPGSVLEVGAGNGLVAEYLAKRGIEVKTIDIDQSLEPDYSGSVTAMPIPDGSYDLVLASLVLEHLPFGEVDAALKEIARVTRRSAVIAVPDMRTPLVLSFKLPFVPWQTWVAKLPFPKRHRFDGQHYWELGKIGSSVGDLRRKFEAAGFAVVRDFVPADSSATHFFILTKR